MNIWYITRMKPSEILPCPLCDGQYPLREDWDQPGASHTVDAGAGSSDSDEVRCLRCRLKININWPDRFPRNSPKGPYVIKMRFLRKWCLAKAIELWNKLPRNMGKGPLSYACKKTKASPTDKEKVKTKARRRSAPDR